MSFNPLAALEDRNEQRQGAETTTIGTVVGSGQFQSETRRAAQSAQDDERERQREATKEWAPPPPGEWRA
jgi:hypothetical protein